MSAVKNGGPAFPQTHAQPTPGGGIHYTHDGGMTLRDWFAGQAISGACSPAPDGWSISPSDHAEWAYQMADAMLAARGDA
jgi:hypothetical protein